MGSHIILLLLLILMSNVFSQDQTAAENRGLDDVVIKETYETGTEEEKLPVFLKADFSNMVEIRERINWSSVPWSTGEPNLSSHLFECQTSSPEMVEIGPAPAKVFHVDFEDLASWKLDVLTGDGTIFCSLKGEGDPPNLIPWDGHGDSGSPLTPGEQYAYSFTATDKAGNRRTFPGEAFSVPALYLNTENGLWIGLSNSLLFSPEGYGLLNAAESYSTELSSLIYYYSNGGSIRIQSEHPDTERFLELLAKKLGKDVTYFEKIANKGPEKNCFVMWLN